MSYRPEHPLALVDVVRFLIVTLTKMASARDWGEIKITVQDGQIVFVHQNVSYRDKLPALGRVDPAKIPDQQLRNLAAVG